MADERDPKVSRRYREMGAEEPPRALDEKILAASRRAVDAHPAPLVAPTGRRRWYFPVAAAAVIMLAVAVTLQIERQKPDEEVVASAPAQAQKETKVQTGPASAETPKPMRAPEPKQKQRQFTPEPPPPASQPAAPAPQATEPPRELAKSNEQAAGAMSGSRAAEAPAEARARSDSARDSVAAAPAPAMRREMGQEQKLGQLQSKIETPEATLERIAELRKQGKHDEADKALAEFRQRYPGYVLSDEMKAKVERK